MDGNNWRAAQAQAPGGGEGGGAAAGAMESGDWRTQLMPDSRQRIVNKIMETLKRHLPVSGQEGVQELKKIAVRFEEKIYSAATSQQDYLRKISLKMLTMETKSQPPMTNSVQPNPASSGQNALGPGSHSMQSQVNSQAQQLPVPMVANQTQTRQPLLQQNLQNNMASTGLQNSASLAPSLPSVSNLTQGTMPNVVGQNSNLQTMQNMPNVGQNLVGNAIGQGMPPNMVANSQRQMQGRQQQVVSQQQQQQSQTTQQYMYQQQLHQHQMMKQKFQPGSTSQSLMQSHMQQQQQPQEQQQQLPQQQQNLLQPTQTQPSQQAMMQPSSIQSTSLSNLQQSQQSTVQQSTQSVLHQRQQSVMRQQQAPMLHQQQSSMLQPPILPAQQHQQQQQQQQLIAQQTNVANLQQNQLMSQQNAMPDVQQRLVGQQNNYMHQQNNFQNMHQQQLGSQSSIAGVQQQQLSGSQQPGNSGLTSNQHPIHLMQQPKVPVQQQMLQSTTTLLPNQGQQSQSQPAQQQMMSQSQSQPGQLQPPLGLQQQANQLQREMQQRLQPSAPLLQQQNVMEQQKQLYQSQRVAPEASSTSLDSTAQTGNANAADWQEEVYQKVLFSMVFLSARHVEN